uniref:Uncharacterized protein n=1 Tax=Anguilla anguilla TaxID=7936 RepID=A0A0E9TYW4_ANGAN
MRRCYRNDLAAFHVEFLIGTTRRRGETDSQILPLIKND